MSEARPLTINEVGRLFGFDLPGPGRGKASRSRCPMRPDHKRKDPTFIVYLFPDGREGFKCFACDSPGNVGDAIALCSALSGLDRKSAWTKLKNEGYAVPGLRDDDRFGGRGAGGAQDAERRAYENAQKKSAHAIPVAGRQPPAVLALDQAKLAAWLRLDAGVLGRYGRDRGIDAQVLRSYGMLEVGGPYVGFVYIDPETGTPCRVKIRSVEEKKFWIEPRPPEGDRTGARAAGPLYLAHLLWTAEPDEPVIITEGEIDALSLMSIGLRNVVSLPDGAESAKTADLRPLLTARLSPWAVATDDDKAGDDAANVLRARAQGHTVLRVRWARPGGDDLERFKDANDAVRGYRADGVPTRPMDRAELVRCLDVAAEDRVSVQWPLAG